MQLNVSRIRQCLKEFNFHPIFTEELGWEHYTSHLNINIDNQDFTLTAISQKRGMATFNCTPPDNGHIPDYALRRKIEQRVAKSVHEHIIVYTDRDKTRQVWQWVRREAGKPTACREHIYHCSQPGDVLIQKLQSLAFSLVEEEHLTIVDVARRARAAFDVERVTKRFYDRFKSEHEVFLKFIKGIPDEESQRWYASVMLNRLMFIYFIQKKGFLDTNTDYLRTKLVYSKEHGKDCFYRDFLCPLFFEGFAKKESEGSKASNQLLGKVPYLNGGIFQRHQIEELHGREIHIADTTFEKLFDFFDQYQWHLDERPLRQDNEINPDVLGYIFEKYINQKQMGAYYTKEDITEYISKNTVVPFIFDAVRHKYKIAFEGEQSIWRFLQSDPDRYIYDAVRKGIVDEQGNIIPEAVLPDFVQKGIHDANARMFDKRYNLAEADLCDNDGTKRTLPTETWREYTERRKRCLELRSKFTAGEINDINNLITYNLNIRQFAQDAIENCESPDLLRAFWHAIERVTVLDPTCGSGAFLFAVLNILSPLYEACLQRMEAFVDDLERSGEKHRPEKLSDFRKILERVEKHPNRRYFILKSIIVNNLYGVDIMEEAVEICKLRLFLKLVAQVERVEEIEPLPDIDFNIRSGNTLVGYASYDEVKKAVTSETTGQFRIQFDDVMKRIDEKAQDIERLFVKFREQQTEIGGEVTPADKQELKKRLKILEDELNRYLASEYGIDSKNIPNKTEYQRRFAQWHNNHKPFHWFIEFYGIMNHGGFDVIIGNPPFLEVREVNYAPHNFKCIKSDTIHALCVEQGLRLLNKDGYMSMIFPMSIVSTQRMKVLQELLEEKHELWYANYAWRPAKLFNTVNRAISIFVVAPSIDNRTFSTRYQKWTSDNRDLLMAMIDYVEVPNGRPYFWIPKIGCNLERIILEKMLNIKNVLSRCFVNSGHKVYYRTTGGLYWKVFTDFPPAFKVNGKKGRSTRETRVMLNNVRLIRPTIAVLSSDLFWWWYTITTTCRDLNPYDIQNFPIPETIFEDRVLHELGEKYLHDIQGNSTMMVRIQKQTGRTETQSFKIQKSKPIIDKIDRVLAQHYGLTDEELDFIINYDIKYRMGIESENEEVVEE